MSSLTPSETFKFETLFEMSSGYVLNFSDVTFSQFFAQTVDVDIHDDKYCEYGTSKAKKLRCFWKNEDDHSVGKLLGEMVEYAIVLNLQPSEERERLQQDCRAIAIRLQGGSVKLHNLKAAAESFNSAYIAKQIERMEKSVESDPALAIGTAKELIETCCKSILTDRGVVMTGTPNINTLTKTALKELHLVPETVSDSTRGKDTVKKILSNLATIGVGLAELRSLYGTGHGKESQTKGLHARHAKLAIGSASTLVTFLFETHKAKH